MDAGIFLYLLLKSRKYDINQVLRIVEKEFLISEIDSLGIELVRLRRQIDKHQTRQIMVYALPSLSHEPQNEG